MRSRQWRASHDGRAWRVYEHFVRQGWRLGLAAAKVTLGCCLEGGFCCRGQLESARKPWGVRTLPPPSRDRQADLCHFVPTISHTCYTPIMLPFAGWYRGYQYRLCPLKSKLTEACFQETPVPFAGDSTLLLGNGTKIKLNSTFVSEGTLPAGSTWQMNPIPGYVHISDPKKGGWSCCKRWFDPPCDDPQSLNPPQQLSQGLCSGEWITKVTTYDQLRIPEHLEPGEYVLGFRWDCEASAQM